MKRLKRSRPMVRGNSTGFQPNNRGRRVRCKACSCLITQDNRTVLCVCCVKHLCQTCAAYVPSVGRTCDACYTVQTGNAVGSVGYNYNIPMKHG